MQPASIDFSFDFRPRQIVYLEYQGSKLYAEVIQLVEFRHMCWVRPLMLANPTDGLESCDCQSTADLKLPLYDLRYASDLLFPLSLFHAALDTEVMPLLVQLYALQPHNDTIRVAQRQIHQFIQHLWQACPDRFQGEDRKFN